MTRTDREVLVRGVREAIGITIDAAHGHALTRRSAVVGRANLDGSEARGVIMVREF
jgi:hypothetical protein